MIGYHASAEVVRHLLTTLNICHHLNQVKNSKNRMILGSIQVMRGIMPMVMRKGKLLEPLFLLKGEKSHKKPVRLNKPKWKIFSKLAQYLKRRWG